MAMYSVIGKASRTVVPLITLCAIASPRILCSFVIKAAEHGGGDVHEKSFGFSHQSNFSRVSDTVKRVDQKLMKVLKSQIKSFDLSDIQAPQAPSGFPFEIEDIPGEDKIKLKRELDGEKIEVEVYYDPTYPGNWSGGTIDVGDDDGGGGDNSSTDSSDDEELQKRSISFDEPHIRVTVDIIREGGATLIIWLWANVGYIGRPDIFVDDGSGKRTNVDLKYQEDYWREFIRVRGIDDSIGKFLMDYMEWRKERHYLLLLKKLGEVVNE